MDGIVNRAKQAADRINTRKIGEIILLSIIGQKKSFVKMLRNYNQRTKTSLKKKKQIQGHMTQKEEKQVFRNAMVKNKMKDTIF